MNENKEQKLNQAARELNEEISQIKWKLERAGIIIQEQLEEYFEKFDRDDQEDHLGIVWDFERNRIYANIIADYVYEATKIIDELEKRAHAQRQENNNAA
jgi:hypothetical protein